jgi:hypothetical protein
LEADVALGQAIAPAPIDAESWVAVLITIARQLNVAGHENAAAHIYEAVAEFAAGGD